MSQLPPAYPLPSSTHHKEYQLHQPSWLLFFCFLQIVIQDHFQRLPFVLQIEIIQMSIYIIHT